MLPVGRSLMLYITILFAIHAMMFKMIPPFSYMFS